MSEYLSRSVDNDDLRHYQFARTSGLPRGYFAHERMSTLGRAVIVAMILAALAALAIWVRR